MHIIQLLQIFQLRFLRGGPRGSPIFPVLPRAIYFVRYGFIFISYCRAIIEI